MMKLRMSLTLVIFLVAFESFVFAQPTPLTGFDDYVAQAVRDWDAPGLAVAVVKDGQLIFSKGYGVRELGRAEPVDVHTLFAIGSTTKAMTAAAIGMLVDEGKVGWDDPVTKHLHDFKLRDPYVTREVTVRDLLTHRAGLGNADFLWYGQDNSRRDIIHRLRFLEPATSMRSHFTYQNIMYATAGEIVASASGMSWADFVRSRILQPLGMSDTVTLLKETRDRPNVASPHDRIDGNVTVIENASVDSVAPAGSIWSSVEDMAKWMILMLEGKISDGRTLLEDSTWKELFAPQFIVDPSQFYPTAQLTQPHWTTYGLGWFQHDYDGRAVDFHTGSIDGMVAIIGLIRDERLGVYVLGNLDHAEVRHALMYRVFDAYGDGPRRDWSSDLRELYGELDREAEERQKEMEPERIADAPPSHPLAEYAAMYSDSLYGTLRVSFDDGLSMRYGPGLEGKLEHWHYDTFRVRWNAAWRGTSFVTFILDTHGRLSSLQVLGATMKREKEKVINP